MEGDQPTIDEEEAEPRFLLFVGPEPMPVEAVAAVLKTLRPAGLVLRTGGGDIGAVQALRQLTRSTALAFLVEDDLDLALELGADGVHLRDGALVRHARERLEPGHILGAAAGLSRHDAMTAGEDGADYVAFGQDSGRFDNEIIDLVRWWRSTTVLPSLAYAGDASQVEPLVEAGADFIGITSAIVDRANDPETVARSLCRAIETSGMIKSGRGQAKG